MCFVNYKSVSEISLLLSVVWICLIFQQTIQTWISSKKQTSKVNKNVESVQFKHQFPKDFIRPYGETVRPAMATTSDFKCKLKPFTCEWLARLFVDASELTATIDSSLEKLTNLTAFSEEQSLLEITGRKMRRWRKVI